MNRVGGGAQTYSMQDKPDPTKLGLVIAQTNEEINCAGDGSSRGRMFEDQTCTKRPFPFKASFGDIHHFTGTFFTVREIVIFIALFLERVVGGR